MNCSNPSFCTRNGESVGTYGTSHGYLKISAITAYRNATGKGLKESKEAVETVMVLGVPLLIDWNPKTDRNGVVYTREQFVEEMNKAGFEALPSQTPYYSFSKALEGLIAECDANGDCPRRVGMSLFNKAIAGSFTGEDFAQFSAQFEGE